MIVALVFRALTSYRVLLFLILHYRGCYYSVLWSELLEPYSAVFTLLVTRTQGNFSTTVSILHVTFALKNPPFVVFHFAWTAYYIIMLLLFSLYIFLAHWPILPFLFSHFMSLKTCDILHLVFALYARYGSCRGFFLFFFYIAFGLYLVKFCLCFSYIACYSHILESFLLCMWFAPCKSLSWFFKMSCGSHLVEEFSCISSIWSIDHLPSEWDGGITKSIGKCIMRQKITLFI